MMDNWSQVFRGRWKGTHTVSGKKSSLSCRHHEFPGKTFLLFYQAFYEFYCSILTIDDYVKDGGPGLTLM